MKFQIRTAIMNDKDSIRLLIKESVRELALQDYSSEQIEAALKAAWGLDTQLIKDQTYFVVEFEQVMVACGGWSFRKTLFGNDSEKNRAPETIDPVNGAAKIRAFFVKPDFSRQGLGSMIMKQCEQEALHQGYKKLELMSTLPGIKLYERHGFVASKGIEYDLGNQLTISFVPMKKEIVA